MGQRELTAAVVVSAERGALERISEPGVVAVYEPPDRGEWMTELAEAVAGGRFQLPRTVLGHVSRPEVARWLDDTLPVGAVSGPTRAALRADVLSLLDLARSLTGASRFIVRAFAEAPTRRCGYHVDTTPPRAPTLGVLRVYNGLGTTYADPANVVGAREFYAYLGRREALGRELAAAASVRGPRYAELLDEVLDLDEDPGFLADPDAVGVVPAGSIVAFRHLDAREHWSSHAVDRAWIHCSPMEGEPRLVVNVTPAGDFPPGGPA